MLDNSPGEPMTERGKQPKKETQKINKIQKRNRQKNGEAD